MLFHFSSFAFFPVASTHRWIATATYAGESSIARHRLPRRSHAMIEVPDPENGS
jgi:hypothetical protein